MYNKILFCVLLLMLYGCSNLNEPQIPPGAQRGTLLKYQHVGHASRDTVLLFGNHANDSLALHAVDCYSITYLSEYCGKPQTTDAIVMIPHGVDSMHLTMYLSGTMIPLSVLGINRDVPSRFKINDKILNSERFVGTRDHVMLLSSSGLAVIQPDYMGYGSTEHLETPFVCYQEENIATLDALRAVCQLFDSLDLKYNRNIFLTGFSLGAGAALHLHRWIERDYADEFTVIATSSLAGPYNIYGIVHNLFENPDSTFHNGAFYPWAAYVVNAFTPTLQRPTDQIFTCQVYDQTSSFFNTTTHPIKLFNPSFVAHVLDGTDTAFINAVKLNTSATGWTPKGKVYLYHGKDDRTVGFFNSVDAYNNLKAAGGDVYLIKQEGDHGEKRDYYISNTIIEFRKLLNRGGEYD